VTTLMVATLIWDGSCPDSIWACSCIWSSTTMHQIKSNLASLAASRIWVFRTAW
jgi:hypothetical protein